MLTAIRSLWDEKVTAFDSEKSDAPFHCPACNDPVILKQGRVVAWHFAHKPPVSCAYGLGESEAHRLAKMQIATELTRQGTAAVEIEKRIGDAIADVYCETADGKKVAIEVQISKLTMDQIIERTAVYQRLGVHVLWLVPWDNNLNDDRYSPRQYEKWLHVLNFGRVYYYLGEAFEVQPVHLGDHQLYVEATDFGGGYWKSSKRYKTPEHTSFTLTELSDYRPTSIGHRQLGDYYVPNVTVLLDKFDRWWESPND